SGACHRLSAQTQAPAAKSALSEIAKTREACSKKVLPVRSHSSTRSREVMAATSGRSTRRDKQMANLALRQVPCSYSQRTHLIRADFAFSGGARTRDAVP